VHGALTLLDVPPSSPAAAAGLKRGDVIFGVGNPRPAIGEELLLRIAVAPPNSNVVISFFDGRTREKRQVTVKTVPLQ
jgi:S1-C subfamily serine protease